MRLLFLLFGRAIHRYIAKGYLRPKEFAGMDMAFSGPDGRAYYTWMDSGEMTPIREKQIEMYLSLADARISAKELTMLCDMLDEANMEAMKATGAKEKSKAHSRIAFLSREIRERPDLLPEDVYYGMAAVFAVREDEDPRAFDVVVQGQKIDLFKKEGLKGHDFFVKLSGLKQRLGASLTTESAFVQLVSAWAARRARMEAIRLAFAQPSVSR